MSDAEPIEPIESDFEGIWYRWTCGACSETNETEIDIRDAEVECDSCGETSTVRGSL